ncbi:soluble lamin-associated protein of 75 kDa [Pimephales promelas]|uniref:soluble lamin-associated protein of 75 kDa n=1 Tax=Pimephales promelas TaxID=90988 RepID=UPI001955D7F4|nr:soluble lamin-associated protein of 75 kDa [Pimephales promelas]KAG1943324.1 soluble lamin-associated protein of 75 kDa [Pimephales promelas]KAG1943325.1 soluble lamin-associated protein of 75 kDa [Pimephales promelas]
MEFPVDVLVSVRHEDLESSAQSYMNKLLYSNPNNTQYLTLPSTRKILISPANVGFVPLYGTNLKHKVLALFAPEDQFTAVALFLADQWYTVEDILRTSNPTREGLAKVRSVGERIVLYVLNRIIYRTAEMGSNEVPFLCHGEDEDAKILWTNGEAVGFYSVKSKGSLCNTFVSQCYLLPVMDSIFVRKDHRGNGHGLQMLEDFVDSFKDDELGLKYPLTLAMQKVCRQYLNKYPVDVDLLWEVEGVGGPYQKVKVASKLGSLILQCNNSSWAAEEGKNGEVAVNEVEMNEESCLDITEDVVVVNKHLTVAEEINDLPISTRTRSIGHKQKKRPRDEPEESDVENQPEKMSRLVEPEAETEPDAVVPETKKQRDGEEEEEETLVQVKEAVTAMAPATDTEILVAEVNGEISDSQEVNIERSADTSEDAQADQVCPLEPDAVIQNGAVEEMEVEREAQDDIIDTPKESEEPSEGMEQIDQELVTEEQQEAETEVALPVEDEGEVEQEQNEEVTPAVEEEGVSAVEENEDTRPPAVPEAPVLQTDLIECVSSVQDSEASEEPAVPEQEAPEEETATFPSATGEEGVIIKTKGPTMNQEDETASDEPLETEESQPAMEDSEKERPEEENPPETGEKDKQKEEDNTVTTEDDDEGKSSDETHDSSPGVRVLRGGRGKPVPPTPKRTSGRLSKAVVVQVLDEEFDEEEEEEEEKLTSTEEEKGSTEEDEAAEHNSEDEEEPPVIDRRVLRRKTRAIQSTPTKAKRRSKN